MKKRKVASILGAIMAAALIVTALPKMNLMGVSADTAGGETAVISRNEVTLETFLRTSSDVRYSQTSPISDFIDSNGVYTIAYADSTKVFISHISDELTISDVIKIKKPMPKIGGVCCDTNGNFYIACGQEDEKKKLGSMTTFAIYKYSPSGKLLGKCEDRDFVCYDIDLFDETETEVKNDYATRNPFHFGNCAMAFRGDLLICSYAREMYNGHQSNAVFCVDTKTMTRSYDYDSFTGHSFNQAVLVTKGLASCKEGSVIFADQSDGFPTRGFHLSIEQEPDPVDKLYWLNYDRENTVQSTPFHFYGEEGNNFTGAKLTGIGELDKGIVLVGSSVKDMTKKSFEEGHQQMFVQMLDAVTGKPLLSASSRTGTSKGKKETDPGIMWLTNYNNVSVGASAMVPIDKDQVLVMWEKLDKNSNFVNSYYSIVRSDGKILKNSVSMQNVRINGTEELKYQNGYVTWMHVSEENQGSHAAVYRMNVNKTTMDNIINAVVVMDDNFIYDGVAEYSGKAIQPVLKVTYEGKTLKKGNDYTLSYSNNKKIGIAKIKVKGKGNYKGTLVQEFQIVPPEVKDLTGTYSDGKVKLSWKKTTGASGYEILIVESDYGSVFDLYEDSVKTTIKRTTKTSYSESLSKSKNRTYYIRPYADVKGTRIYGYWNRQPMYTVGIK